MDKLYSEFELFDMLKSVQDPEIGASIVDLGLVYGATHGEEGISVDFTLTSAGCPLVEELRTDIVLTLKKKTGVGVIRANLVWMPPWDQSLMTDELKLEMGFPIW
jgi:metal-sulfur cluster biosynthetic enzyme